MYTCPCYSQGMDTSTETLLGLAQLATKLGLPLRWLKQEAQAGRLPHLQAGGRLLFNLHAVKRALADRAAREGWPFHVEGAGDD